MAWLLTWQYCDLGCLRRSLGWLCWLVGGGNGGVGKSFALTKTPNCNQIQEGHSPYCALLNGDSWDSYDRVNVPSGRWTNAALLQTSWFMVRYRTKLGLFSLIKFDTKRQHTLGNREDKLRPSTSLQLCVQIIPDPHHHAKQWAQHWHPAWPSLPVLILGTNNSTKIWGVGKVLTILCRNVPKANLEMKVKDEL